LGSLVWPAIASLATLAATGSTISTRAGAALHSEAIDTDDSAPGMRPPVGYSSGDAEENREGG
jgi:hypothetical protein